MGKPRMIILIRHGQSEGNRNREIHQTVPDHRVKLTPEGWAQACDAGKRLRTLLRPDDTLHFFTSPYRRARETTEGILRSLTSGAGATTDGHEAQSLHREHPAVPREKITIYEEPRLREQDFGNFQPCSREMERMWKERAEYGHFFYRIPNGESAADAYDRVSGFNESLWRLFGDKDCGSVCVLVTHGLMTRVFLMKWYHFSVEYFEDLRNIDHCEFVVMKKNPTTDKYVLQNKLRTWSELERQRTLERAAARGEHVLSKAISQLAAPIPVRRYWDGCMNGDPSPWEDPSESKRSPYEQRIQDNDSQHSRVRQPDDSSSPSPAEPAAGLDEADSGAAAGAENNTASTPPIPTPSSSEQSVGPAPGPSSDNGEFAISEAPEVSAYIPTRTSSLVRKWARMKLGRDGGGSESGASSPSVDEEEEEGNDEGKLERTAGQHHRSSSCSHRRHDYSPVSARTHAPNHSQQHSQHLHQPQHHKHQPSHRHQPRQRRRHSPQQFRPLRRRQQPLHVPAPSPPCLCPGLAPCPYQCPVRERHHHHANALGDINADADVLCDSEEDGGGEERERESEGGYSSAYDNGGFDHDGGNAIYEETRSHEQSIQGSVF